MTNFAEQIVAAGQGEDTAHQLAIVLDEILRQGCYEYCVNETSLVLCQFSIAALPSVRF